MNGTLGKWDEDLFQRYREAKGEKRRRLASELIRINTPLIITIIEQLCGRAKPVPGRRTTAATKMGGKGDFDQIPFEDAMQCGRIAFAKAIEQYDPTKGKISWYLCSKSRHELQTFVTFQLHLARVPRGREKDRAPVDFMGDLTPAAQLDVEEMSSNSLGIVEGVDITPAEVEEWENDKDANGRPRWWPESMEDVVAWREARATKLISIPNVVLPVDTGWMAFLKRCVLNKAARVPVFTAWNAYRNECDQRGEVGVARAQFVRELVSVRPKVRETSLWIPAGAGRPFPSTERGLAGFRLSSASV